MRLSRFLICAAALLGLLAAPAPLRAQASATAVKAAFLPRFARYVTWPMASRPSTDAPMVLCIIGGDPFGTLIDSASRGQTVDGRRLIVRRLDGPAAAGGCHIAYVQGSRTVPVGQMLAALSGKAVLTVTDAANGGQRGIIHFAVVSGRVRFFIDESAARERGLSVSSRLLALAVGVRQ